jgi:hypothetical protein
MGEVQGNRWSRQTGGMTRRRLNLAIVTAVLCGVDWWLSLDGLSAEERLLVGTWERVLNSHTVMSRWRFWPDRRFAFRQRQPSGEVSMVELNVRWFVRDGAIIIDSEPSAIRRAVRPVLRGLRLRFNDSDSIRLDSIAADKLVLLMSDGTRETWTRAPAE